MYPNVQRVQLLDTYTTCCFLHYIFNENALYKFTVDIDIDIQNSTRRQCELGITLVIDHVTCKITEYQFMELITFNVIV